MIHPTEIVNGFVRGLHQRTDSNIQEQVLHLPQTERASTVLINQLVEAVGRSQLANLQGTQLVTTGHTRHMAASATETILMIVGQVQTQSIFSTDTPSTP